MMLARQGMNSAVPSPDSVMDAVRPLQDELRRCRLEAEETRQRLVDFISTVSDAMWETDGDLRIVRRDDPRNPGTPGRGKADDNDYFIGKSALELSGGDAAGGAAGGGTQDPLLAAHHDDLRCRRPFHGFVHRIVRPDGSVIWRESAGIPFFDRNGVFQGYRGTARDITRRKTDEARIAFLARYDALTNLPNRGLFRERLEKSLAETRQGQSLAVLIVDLDGFKTVNDTLGHPVGDNMLRIAGERLSGCIRNNDTVSRVGSDEFAIVQVDLAEPREAAAFAQRLVDVMGQPYEIDSHRIAVGVTIGIALAPKDGVDPDHLLKNAEIALYRAKLDDPGAWRFFRPEMGLLVAARRTLENELRSALGNGEFELFYQPFYNVQSGEICAFEALLRWRHPQHGMVFPDQFIPLAEETGLIVPIGEWVLRKACAEAAGWPAHINVSVNLSSVQFRKTTPVEAVLDALSASGLAASRLELEITETVLMKNSEGVLAALHELRELGSRISMDDFGTGYSSLSYLRSFPFDKIKIDRSFIQDLAGNPAGKAIFRAIAALGSSLQMATTAEGVETMAQFAIIRAEGCTEVQGYLFGEPAPAKNVREMLDRRGKQLLTDQPLTDQPLTDMDRTQRVHAVS